MFDLKTFFEKQLAEWPLARDNYQALSQVETKDLGDARAQFNPARIGSTGAKVDKASLRSRTCFLCHDNRPKQQHTFDWGRYEILVNPYPIFPQHLTIVSKVHEPQSIDGRVADMCKLAQEMPDMVVFYNGPKCGASAPDHMHFQAGTASFLPERLSPKIGTIEIQAATPEDAQQAFDAAVNSLPALPGEEPMMNVLCRYADGRYRITIIPRKRHRPACYGDGPGQTLVSPASVDLAGVFILPRERDFKAFDQAMADKMYDELCYSPEELQAARESRHTIKVGIMSASEIELQLMGEYLVDGDKVTGLVNLNARYVKEPMLFVPLQTSCRAEVKDVTIGINFHWERKENQRFVGKILIVPEDGQLTLINILSIEDYLQSVISSEMSATSQLELLKAHAVISRSWALAQILRRKSIACDGSESCCAGSETDASVGRNFGEAERKSCCAGSETDASVGRNFGACVENKCGEAEVDTPIEMRIRWYGGNDHTIFDVCADDHCQRYQGVTRQTTPTVAAAVNETAGEVLMADGELCDTRFSKSCGGAFEEYESCWEPEHKSYLIGKLDWPEGQLPDLRDEENATRWILSEPKAFCNTTDKAVLSQVLNGYDQETVDFYRWTVEYTAEQLSELVARKSGIDFGRIIDLQPQQRGTSGRIIVLRVVGEKRTVDIGKELEIRRILSESHLYSSAFVVEKTDGGFRLRGAGWGHGVGLCQIGAAVMAAKGYNYRQILAHYYPGSELVKY